MKITEARSKGLFSTKIDLTPVFEDEEQNTLEGEYVVFRELTADEQTSLEKVDPSEYATAFKKSLPDLIVGSSFTDDEGQEAKPKDVADLILSSTSVFSYVIEKWGESLPFVKRSKKKSETLQGPSSTGATSQGS